MNLYCIKFRHYSPKDSEEGIEAFVVAETEDQVIDKLGIWDSELEEESALWGDNEDEEVTRTYRGHLLAYHGDIFENPCDLDYGFIHHYWELALDGSTVSKEEFQTRVEHLQCYGVTVHE